MRQHREQDTQPERRDEAISVDAAERYQSSSWRHLSRLTGRAEVMVGAGAIIGVLARYALGNLVTQHVPTIFPLGTLLINLIGCLVIGVVQTLFLDFGTMRREMQLFLSVGLCGGFTTFSTFSMETIKLIQDGHAVVALGYQLLALVGGIGAVGLGMAIARRGHRVLIRRRTARP